MKFIYLSVYFVLLLSSTFAEEGFKQGLLNKLLAPGPLIESHKDLEKVDCLSCHDAGKGVPNDKCLACHKVIKASIEKKKSFHGMIANKNCMECHTDHKGRDFDSTKIPENKNFNHNSTGHSLHGKHAELRCIECHKESRSKLGVRKDGIRFIGAMSTCKSCHQKADVHLFKNEFEKKDCSSCHTETKWTDKVSFSHSKETKFELMGKHAEMSCGKCHTPNGEKVGPSVYQWQNLEKDQCLSCHKPFHKNNLSENFNDGKCNRCHDQESWKINKFNHQITGFAFSGKHSELTCVKCHKGNEKSIEVNYQLSTGPAKVLNHNWKGLENKCISCHTDPHFFGKKYVSKKFGLMENCQSCHNEKSFKESINFNHNLDTRFKIDGKHKETACVKCHIPTDPQVKDSPRMYQFKDFEKDTCISCHQSPHLKTFSQKNNEKRCSSCHVTSSWKETRNSENFNHNMDTNFALDGSHTKLACKECHLEGEKKTFKFEARDRQFCISCHSNVHMNQFSEKFNNKSCLECHNTSSFKDLIKFDHNKTNFSLTGKHANPQVKCFQCHKPTDELLQYKGKTLRKKNNFKFVDDKKGQCTSCHQNVHHDQFSKNTQSKSCLTCHSTDNFHQRKPFDHNKATSYPLIGFHEKASCTKCHKETGKNFSLEESKFKSAKHHFTFNNLKTDSCKTCHNDPHKGDFGNSCKECHQETKKWKTTQNFHKDFMLTGVHYSLKCNECHKNQRRLGGMSENCQICHMKDDKHHGTLMNCKECHKQEFWEVTTFNHSRSGFPLRGSHRTLSCDSCHSNGMYQGKSSDCISCHLKDKNKSTTTNHNIAGFENCNQCHNQFVFK